MTMQFRVSKRAIPCATASDASAARCQSLLALVGVACALALTFALTAGAVSANPKVAAEPSKHPCGSHALKRAKPLLRLHTDGDDRAEVDTKVTVLPPIRIPANPKQVLEVLGVTGWVYKAEYRLRFIYAPISGECVLIGQEILERSSF